MNDKVGWRNQGKSVYIELKRKKNYKKEFRNLRSTSNHKYERDNKRKRKSFNP